MIVTSRTIHRQTQEPLADMLDRFFHPLGAIEEPVVPREVTARSQLAEIVRMGLIRREHQPYHLIVRGVIIE